MQPDEQRRGGPTYVVIPRVLIFLTCGDYVLLLRGAPDKKLWPDQYNGLGGHVEAGETPYQAALREIREESGLIVDALTLRAMAHITLPHPPGVMMFVFVGTMAGDNTPQLSASKEGIPVWVKRSEILTLPLVEDLPQLLPRVLRTGPLIFGHYAVTTDGLHITFDEMCT